MYLYFRLLIFVLLIASSCKEKNESSSGHPSNSFSSFIELAEDEKNATEKRIGFALMADSIATIAKNDKQHLKCLRIIAALYLEDSPRLARSYFLKTAELAKTIGDSETLATAYSNIGLIFYNKAAYDSAIYYYSNAYSIFQSLGNQEGIAQVLVNQAMVYKNQGNYEDAYRANLNAIKALEVVGNKEDMASAYTTMGNILKELNRFDEALQYHKMALKIFREQNDTVHEAGALNNMGTVFRYKHEYEKALFYYEKSLEIKEKKGDEKAIATTEDNLGETYYELKDYNKAEIYLEKAFALRSAGEDKDGYITTANRLSKLFLEQNKTDNARTVALIAFKSSPMGGLLKQRIENNLILSEIFQKAGQERLALNYTNKAIELKDSLFNEDLAGKISQMKVRYETEKREKENAILKNDLVIKSAKIAEQKHQKLIVTISGIFIFLLASLVLYITSKSKDYLFRQQISEVKQEALNAQMSDHFISNAMDSINCFIENNDKEKASEYLLLFNRLIRKVLENSFKKLIPLKEELEVLKIYIELEKLRFEDNMLRYEIAIDTEIDTETTLIPPMVFQVLAENAIKHGFKKTEGGLLKLKIEHEGDCILCSVEDDGAGRKEVGYSNAGAGRERTSLGSSLAEKLIKTAIGSEKKMAYKIIDLKDGANKPSGTRVEFILPRFLPN